MFGMRTLIASLGLRWPHDIVCPLSFSGFWSDLGLWTVSAEFSGAVTILAMVAVLEVGYPMGASITG